MIRTWLRKFLLPAVLLGITCLPAGLPAQNFSNGFGFVPPGLIVGNVYGYTGGYSVADTLFPGKGYWLKSDQEGVVLLGPKYSSGGIPEPGAVPGARKARSLSGNVNSPGLELKP